jgi:WD40 repeat protein
MAATFDGNYVLVGYSSGLVSLRNPSIASPPPIREYGHSPGFDRNNTPTTSLAVLSSNAFFASAGINGSHSGSMINLWDVTRSGTAGHDRDSPVGPLLKLQGGHAQAPAGLFLSSVTSLAASPSKDDVDLIISGGFDGLICAWDVRSKKNVSAVNIATKHNAPSDAVTKVAIDENNIIASTASGDLFVYDLRNLGCTRLHIQASPAVANFVALNADTVVVSCHDCMLRLVSTRDQGVSDPMVVYKGHVAQVEANLGLAVDSHSRYITTCSEDGSLVTYGFVSGEVAQKIEGEEGRAMVRAGKGVVVGGTGGGCRVYNVKPP